VDRAAPLTPSDLRLRIVDSVKLKGVHATSEASGYAIGDLALVQVRFVARVVRVDIHCKDKRRCCPGLTVPLIVCWPRGPHPPHVAIGTKGYKFLV
jgi:hypothetical protein